MEDVCGVGTSFEISETAGLYSQLAGVLAGFAFAALFFILSARLTPGAVVADLSRTLRLMLCGFVTLVLSSLSYALLAGDTANAGRAAMLQLVIAAGFISAGTLLMLSLLALLSRIETADPGMPQSGSIPLLRAVISHGLPLILVLSLYSGIDDYSDARYQSEGFRVVDVFALLAIALAIFGPLIAYALPRYAPATGWAADSNEKVIAYAAVALSVASTSAAFVMSASLGPCATIAEWSILIALAVPLAFMLYVSVHLIRDR